MAVDNDLEQLMDTLGEFGKYQKCQFFLHLLAALTAGVHMLSLVTVAAVPAHRCLVPGESLNDTLPWNSSQVLKWIPKKADDTLDSCSLYENPDMDNSSTTACTDYVFDPTYHPSSRVIEWKMVCGNRWMGAFAQSAYMLGVFTGAVTLGTLADKIGRKKVLFSSGAFQLFFGIVVAFTPEFYSFALLRYLFAIFASAGAYNTAFVMSMEIVGPSKRTPCGLTFQGVFAAGIMLVAFWGWLIKDRFYLQIVYGCHSFILVLQWIFVDESPRWLWGHNQKEEAIKIVRKALKTNGDTAYDPALSNARVFEIQSKPTVIKGADDQQAGLLSLIRTPNLRKRTLNVCLNWFANSLAYYGLSLNTGSLPGNPFLMLFATAFVEIPSYIATTYLIDKLGRRSVISAYMILGGLACIISAIIPTDDTSGKIGVIVVVMMGKLLIAGSFAIIFNYTAELFPTVIRNTAIGVGSMCARLSGALCPLITLLDSLDKTLPIVIFATIAIASGAMSLLLPETLNQPMPQSLEDGERFGEGDTACTTCFGGRRRRNYEVPLSTVEH